jgi:peptidoglycan/LPS O-acetylase OafA/YrhL
LELLGMFLWMAGMLASEGFKPWAWPALSWVGAGAFSIYIWHGLVMGSLFKRVVTPLSDLLSLGDPGRVLLLWGLSVASALVIFVLLDLPVMKWLSRQWAQRVGTRLRYPAPTQ